MKVICHLCLKKIDEENAVFTSGWLDIRNPTIYYMLTAKGYHLEDNPLNIIAIRLHHYLCPECYTKIEEYLTEDRGYPGYKKFKQLREGELSNE